MFYIVNAIYHIQNEININQNDININQNKIYMDQNKYGLYVLQNSLTKPLGLKQLTCSIKVI